MKKNDMILAVVVVIFAAAFFLLYNVLTDKDADSVTIKVDGHIEGVFLLKEEQEITINDGTNVLMIKDGKADMIYADCPDKLCVKQKAISKNNENIVCLPNKVVVEIDGNENSEYDAVTN